MLCIGNFSFCLQYISLIEYNGTNRSRRAYGLNCLRINTAGLLYSGVKNYGKEVSNLILVFYILNL